MEVQPSSPSQTAEEQYHALITSRQFTLQLEFICSLASPAYLNSLTLAPPPPSPPVPPLSQPSFLRYLAHVYSIWSRPEYAKYVQYPNGLTFCRLLVESAEFRRAVASNEWVNDVSGKLVDHWANWRREGENNHRP